MPTPTTEQVDRKNKLIVNIQRSPCDKLQTIQQQLSQPGQSIRSQYEQVKKYLTVVLSDPKYGKSPSTAQIDKRVKSLIGGGQGILNAQRIKYFSQAIQEGKLASVDDLQQVVTSCKNADLDFGVEVSEGVVDHIDTVNDIVLDKAIGSTEKILTLMEQEDLIPDAFGEIANASTVTGGVLTLGGLIKDSISLANEIDSGKAFSEEEIAELIGGYITTGLDVLETGIDIAVDIGGALVPGSAAIGIVSTGISMAFAAKDLAASAKALDDPNLSLEDRTELEMAIGTKSMAIAANVMKIVGGSLNLAGVSCPPLAIASLALAVSKVVLKYAAPKIMEQVVKDKQKIALHQIENNLKTLDHASAKSDALLTAVTNKSHGETALKIYETKNKSADLTCPNLGELAVKKGQQSSIAFKYAMQYVKRRIDKTNANEQKLIDAYNVYQKSPNDIIKRDQYYAASQQNEQSHKVTKAVKEKVSEAMDNAVKSVDVDLKILQNLVAAAQSCHKKCSGIATSDKARVKAARYVKGADLQLRQGQENAIRVYSDAAVYNNVLAEDAEHQLQQSIECINHADCELCDKPDYFSQAIEATEQIIATAKQAQTYAQQALQYKDIVLSQTNDPSIIRAVTGQVNDALQAAAQAQERAVTAVQRIQTVQSQVTDPDVQAKITALTSQTNTLKTDAEKSKAQADSFNSDAKEKYEALPQKLPAESIVEGKQLIEKAQQKAGAKSLPANIEKVRHIFNELLYKERRLTTKKGIDGATYLKKADQLFKLEGYGNTLFKDANDAVEKTNRSLEQAVSYLEYRFAKDQVAEAKVQEAYEKYITTPGKSNKDYKQALAAEKKTKAYTKQIKASISHLRSDLQDAVEVSVNIANQLMRISDTAAYKYRDSDDPKVLEKIEAYKKAAEIEVFKAHENGVISHAQLARLDNLYIQEKSQKVQHIAHKLNDPRYEPSNVEADLTEAYDTSEQLKYRYLDMHQMVQKSEAYLDDMLKSSIDPDLISVAMQAVADANFQLAEAYEQGALATQTLQKMRDKAANEHGFSHQNTLNKVDSYLAENPFKSDDGKAFQQKSQAIKSKIHSLSSDDLADEHVSLPQKTAQKKGQQDLLLKSPKMTQALSESTHELSDLKSIKDEKAALNALESKFTLGRLPSPSMAADANKFIDGKRKSLKQATDYLEHRMSKDKKADINLKKIQQDYLRTPNDPIKKDKYKAAVDSNFKTKTYTGKNKKAQSEGLMTLIQGTEQCVNVAKNMLAACNNVATKCTSEKGKKKVEAHIKEAKAALFKAEANAVNVYSQAVEFNKVLTADALNQINWSSHMVQDPHLTDEELLQHATATSKYCQLAIDAADRAVDFVEDAERHLHQVIAQTDDKALIAKATAKVQTAYKSAATAIANLEASLMGAQAVQQKLDSPKFNDNKTVQATKQKLASMQNELERTELWQEKMHEFASELPKKISSERGGQLNNPPIETTRTEPPIEDSNRRTKSPMPEHHAANSEFEAPIQGAVDKTTVHHVTSQILINKAKDTLAQIEAEMIEGNASNVASLVEAYQNFLGHTDDPELVESFKKTDATHDLLIKSQSKTLDGKMPEAPKSSANSEEIDTHDTNLEIDSNLQQDLRLD